MIYKPCEIMVLQRHQPLFHHLAYSTGIPVIQLSWPTGVNSTCGEANNFHPPQQTVRERHRISSARPFCLKGGILVMRNLLTRALLCSLALTPLLVGAGAPMVSAQRPDDSQNAPQYPSQDNSQGNPPQQDYSQAPNNAGYQNFTVEQLDNLISPIALYPDPLLAQVFVASTFPDQVEEAARYVRGNGTNGVDEQNWDVSVRAVAHYPTVIEMMADKIDWTTSLGQAYVNQSTDVSAAVQRLRHEARRVGNLDSNQQQEVIEHDDYIAINPYQPQYLYVPVYDPAIIYFRRPYWGPAITFGYGYPIGGWLNLGFHWGWGGGYGGVFYTGWRSEGWGPGCWNCGWIGRSRGYVNYHNNVYINNRYNNININRTVINRTVNVNNINRYNYVHKNVNYNNVQANNARISGNSGRGFNGANNANNAGRGVQNNNGARGSAGNNNRPPANANLDRNISNNSRANEFRGRDNTANNNRPGNVQQARPVQENRPQQQVNRPQQDNRPQQSNRPQQQQARPVQQQARPTQQYTAPHAFGHSEGNFNAGQSSQRGQASRQQAQRPVQQPRPQVRQAAAPRQAAPQQAAPQRQAPPAQHSAPNGGGGGRHR